MTPRRFIAPDALIWLLLGAAYFLIPLIATLIFSLRSNQTGTCCTLENYGEIIHDSQFWKTIKTSFILSLETIVLTLVLLVPTVLAGFRELVPVVFGVAILVVLIVEPLGLYGRWVKTRLYFQLWPFR